MIAYDKIRPMVAQGLAEYLGCPVIRGDQSAQAPGYPYASYKITTLAGANNGTWQQHEDGVDRLMVKSIWSLSFIAATWEESVSLALKAREWIIHTGRTYLSEHGITVQSATDITDRDNILSVEYERKNGFDVVFYVFDEVQNLTETYGYIEDMNIIPERTN